MQKWLTLQHKQDSYWFQVLVNIRDNLCKTSKKTTYETVEFEKNAEIWWSDKRQQAFNMLCQHLVCPPFTSWLELLTTTHSGHHCQCGRKSGRSTAPKTEQLEEAILYYILLHTGYYSILSCINLYLKKHGEFYQAPWSQDNATRYNQPTLIDFLFHEDNHLCLKVSTCTIDAMQMPS